LAHSKFWSRGVSVRAHFGTPELTSNVHICQKPVISWTVTIYVIRLPSQGWIVSTLLQDQTVLRISTFSYCLRHTCTYQCWWATRPICWSLQYQLSNVTNKVRCKESSPKAVFSLRFETLTINIKEWKQVFFAVICLYSVLCQSIENLSPLSVSSFHRLVKLPLDAL